MSQLAGVAVEVWTYIREIVGWNPGPEKRDILHEEYYVFPQSVQQVK
jgi:hypothetical protein